MRGMPIVCGGAAQPSYLAASAWTVYTMADENRKVRPYKPYSVATVTVETIVTSLRLCDSANTKRPAWLQCGCVPFGAVARSISIACGTRK
jgi:hypothetical protein